MIRNSLTGLTHEVRRRVSVDPYGPNPLVTDVSARNPALFDMASQRGPAPTLFAIGDLPPFTASGVDADLLANLPFQRRHAAASEPDRAKVLGWLEESGQSRGKLGFADGLAHPGLDDYISRVEGWVAGLKVPDVAVEDAEYPDAWKTPKMRAALDGGTR